MHNSRAMAARGLGPPVGLADEAQAVAPPTGARLDDLPVLSALNGSAGGEREHQSGYSDLQRSKHAYLHVRA